MTGGIGVGLRLYEGFGAAGRQSPFNWTINANTNIAIYKLSIPFSAVITAQNQQFSNPIDPKGFKESLRNRFVRIGASPYYKWAKLHLGHRTMDFSSLTYSGQTFFGTGTELNPGKFRFMGMRGLIPTAEPQDLALFEINREVFNRVATVGKIGYGTDDAFVDFVLMKAADRAQEYTVGPDSSWTAPQENVVMGFNTKFVLFKKISINAELASSTFVNDANAGNITEELSEEFGKEERLEPAVLPGKVHAPGFLLSDKSSASSTWAFDGGWKFNGQGFRCGMDIQRYAPGYRTLGVYYFNDDLQNITGNIGWTIPKLQVSVDLSGGTQSNNLDNTKPTTVRRVIGAANIAFALESFQTSFTYNNFSNQIDFVLNPDLDSLNAVVITQNTALNSSYTIVASDKSKHSFALTGAVQVVNSPSDGSTDAPGTKMTSANLSYTYSPSGNGYRVTVRGDYNQNALVGMLLDRYGAGLGISKAFFDKKLTCKLDNNFFLTNAGTAKQNSLNTGLTIGMKLSAAHNFNLRTTFLTRQKVSGADRDPRQSEMVVGFQYQYKFQVGGKKSDKAADKKEDTGPIQKG